MNIRKVAILGGNRVPFARSFTAYLEKTNQELLTQAIKGLVERFKLQGETLGEVAAGAVVKHTRDWNLSRESALGAGLSPETPAFDIIRACGTGLEATIAVANKIALGQIDSAIAGGTDTNSDAPVFFSDNFQKTLIQSNVGRSTVDKIKPFLHLRPRDLMPKVPGVTEPRTGLSMGESCEIMAQEWNISREEQDELSYESHRRAVAAYEAGFFSDLISPFAGLDKDTNVRPDSSKEKLAKLKPVFEKNEKGTLTAGNSTALTDGASAVLLSSEEWAQKKGIPIQAYLTFSASAAVDFVNHEGLLMAPAYAVPKLLKRTGLKLQDFDYYEIHEAFAAQVLCTLKAWESETFCRDRLKLSGAMGAIDRKKMNVKGGSIALGHPFGATGGRLVATLAKTLDEVGHGRGLISICTGGGMGVTAILEK